VRNSQKSQNGHPIARFVISIIDSSLNLSSSIQSLSSRAKRCDWVSNRNAQSRDLLFASAMKDRCYCVYIIVSKSRVIYIGMTNDLGRRVFEHKNALIDGFTQQYHCHRLVYFDRSTM